VYINAIEYFIINLNEDLWNMPALWWIYRHFVTLVRVCTFRDEFTSQNERFHARLYFYFIL